MPAMKSAYALEALREALDRALAAPKGIALTCDNRGHAVSTCARLNTLRVADRKRSLEIYPEDHPMYGCSIYDRLIIKVPKGDQKVLIEKGDLSQFIVEDIV